MVLQKSTQVLGVLAGNRVESLARDSHCAVAQPAE